MSHFVLVDCNNFYVSCERLFNPWLEGRPVIVLSNNDGCVVARSQEAKQFNIKMGEPFFKIKNFCKERDIIAYSSNYQIYGEISARVMNILSDQAPEIQIYSIDEAFLSYPTSMSAKEMWECCSALKKQIKKWVGIPTSLGIGPSKTLAKIANDLAKKDRTRGIFDLSSLSTQNDILNRFPVEDVWGIGSRTASKLHSLGIFTASEFRDMEPSVVRKKMGVVGERMLWELRGISCLPLEEESAAKKSISCSRSFGKTVTESSDIAEALATFINTASVKLRQQDSYAKAICIYLEAVLDIETGARSHTSNTTALPMPTNDTPKLISIAKQALKKIFCKGKSYKKCGIILLDLISESNVIPDLFLGGIDPKRKLLMETVDGINAQCGKNTLFYGAMGINPQWKMRSDKRSRFNISNWEDLPLAKA
jgi:DNA polymerase V